MSFDQEFLDMLNGKVSEVAARHNVPSEYEKTFNVLFKTYIQLFYLDGALRRGIVQMTEPKMKEIIESLEVSIDMMLTPLLEAMRNLGSQWIGIDEFLKDVEELKSSCDKKLASL